jgi:tetratricopeptide (TPR) repeat protein/TolB-like protein
MPSYFAIGLLAGRFMLHKVVFIGVLGVFLAASAAAQTSSRLLVVPFDNAKNEPRYQWLSEASAVLLTDGLRERSQGAITRGERMNAFEQLHLPVAASLSRATVIKVAQLLGAGEVIVGTFKVEGDQLSVSAQAIRVDVGRVQPAAAETGPLTDLFGVYDRLAKRIAHDAPIGGGSRTAPPPLDAFENFIKGLVAENPATKATFLEAAIRDHAEFDRARLALWQVRTDEGDHDAALANARAIGGPAYARRGRFAAGVSLLELERYDESFEAFKGLLDETDPFISKAAVLNNLGVVQLRKSTQQGASAASHAKAEGSPAYYLTKAADLETDPDYLFNLGYAYAIEKNYQGSLYWLRESLRRDPTDADAHFVLGAALQGTGGTVEAARERDLARQLSARYEKLAPAGASEKLTIPWGLERVAFEPEASRMTRADQVVVDAAQREQRELAKFHLDRGRRLYEKEQDREAMTELGRTVYLSPYEAEAHLLIGRIHLRAGRPGDAMDALKISIWSEETAPARVALAEAYLKAGNSASARVEAERALVLAPESADAKRLLATIK